MSGRDHETNHDGECFPGCKECRLEELEKTIKRYASQSKVVNCTIIHREREEPMFFADGDTGVITPFLDGYAIIPIEQWQNKDNKDA